MYVLFVEQWYGIKVLSIAPATSVSHAARNPPASRLTHKPNSQLDHGTKDS